MHYKQKSTKKEKLMSYNKIYHYRNLIKILTYKKFRENANPITELFLLEHLKSKPKQKEKYNTKNFISSIPFKSTIKRITTMPLKKQNMPLCLLIPKDLEIRRGLKIGD